MRFASIALGFALILTPAAVLAQAAPAPAASADQPRCRAQPRPPSSRPTRPPSVTSWTIRPPPPWSRNTCQTCSPTSRSTWRAA
ncbi:hypothetical protein ACRAWD_27600 [Caulobacter segnis]